MKEKLKPYWWYNTTLDTKEKKLKIKYKITLKDENIRS